eukprot:GHVP01058191.1.p1 GENE.GHVP01058191.1~~GHVP01058191.1.p1  ORF type:complete len:131 (-),score=2.70 GHVP01058191.1:187-579(-)
MSWSDWCCYCGVGFLVKVVRCRGHFIAVVWNYLPNSAHILFRSILMCCSVANDLILRSGVIGVYVNELGVGSRGRDEVFGDFLHFGSEVLKLFSDRGVVTSSLLRCVSFCNVSALKTQSSFFLMRYTLSS